MTKGVLEYKFMQEVKVLVKINDSLEESKQKLSGFKFLGISETDDIQEYTYSTYFYKVILKDKKSLGLFLEVEALDLDENSKDKDYIPKVKHFIKKFITAIGFEFEEV